MYSSSYSYSACGNRREHPSNFQNKSVNSPFNWVSRYILFLPKLKGEKRPFLEGFKKGDHIARLSLVWYKRWKSLSFCEIWNMLPVLCFLLDPLTNKHSRTWSSMINLWIDSKSKESSCQKGQGLIIITF